MYDLYDPHFSARVAVSLPLLTALSLMRDACETLLHTLAKPFIYDITVCPFTTTYENATRMPGGQGQRRWLSPRLDETYHVSTRTTQDDRPHHRGRCAARLRSHICLDHLLRDGDHLPLCCWNAAPDAIAAAQHQHRRVTTRLSPRRPLSARSRRRKRETGTNRRARSRACSDCRIDLDGRDARSRRDPTSPRWIAAHSYLCCGPLSCEKNCGELSAVFFSK